MKLTLSQLMNIQLTWLTSYMIQNYEKNINEGVHFILMLKQRQNEFYFLKIIVWVENEKAMLRHAKVACSSFDLLCFIGKGLKVITDLLNHSFREA